MNRRNFLKSAGAAAMLPVFAPAFAQTPGGSANNRINLGVIGMGWQGPANTKAFLELEDCQVVAVCDIDDKHRAAAIAMTVCGWAGSGAARLAPRQASKAR